ncbi:glutamyl-tRNA amidotransferase [Candidatus Daviesbacteria bacterium RIFCSPHIGHO2_01_FULL_36_37]|uniref:Glutamyl-tRNA amidotransferase n=4 Tax=Candidatus Daviesiibacteriota TaxID=1752718 RepID=A0A1F5K4K6_9BACT|nr:MAG: glutamyl-tRNA amidotransferase [Candidatus Daviesbacteria bacterium RIFCSPHIGHO2_01_FULL_36_37]OGE31190.1 MAG: glutamyl-tRNA amidotransferase [Candidatus Daviesbacteria bacterium RIFCSPHIGHO2_02_FULL_37_9]OGE35819.1 MAG: glutamyl-tRNA amidotransferase [Candidatus Daviesbacteria bacterium RIFCSPHIGHO2_12_FULL_37_16]
MSMETKIKEDLKQAQLNRDEIRLSTLRLLLSEINNSKIQKGSDLTDDEITSVVQKEAKKRRESVESFKKGGREDLAQKEESELKILEAYMPAGLSNEELTKLVEDSINELGANSLADMGKVMSSVMAKVAGRADGSIVSSLVKEKLS